jgi:predicted PurR-regulated permease PerM
MAEHANRSVGSRFLLSAASFVIVVAGMKAATTILIPFILAVFIAIICAPALYWLQHKKVPNALAVLLVVLAILALTSLTGYFVGSSINNFTRSLPAYTERLQGMQSSVVSWLEGMDIKLNRELLQQHFNPGVALQMSANMLTGLGSMATNTFLILLTVIFILLEAAGFRSKLQAAMDDPERALANFSEFTESVNRYLAIKTAVSLATGLVITAWLAILGVNYAVLWGLLAFFLNFVPNIGSFIAAIPAVLLALVQFGFPRTIAVVVGYLVVNLVVGNIIEPKFMGEGLGLSTLVVFLSLIFWGWVLGPVGMLLSVPLTMIVKIALGSFDDTRWIAIMLGTARPAGR